MRLEKTANIVRVIVRVIKSRRIDGRCHVECME
jgi:hypothetical protein